ncbi:MAG: YihY/virulence factor BrkB family protein, partial [Caulobacteraceae bacterium]
AILIGIYSLLFTPDQAAEQAAAFARILPPGAQALFEGELRRLAHAPLNLVSAQSLVAVLIGLYASQRGVKALLAGLSLVHDDEAPRGFVHFNILALGVALAGFALMCVISATFLTIRVMGAAFHLRPFSGLWWMFSEWTWVTVAMAIAFTLIYRWAMSSRPVAWRAAVIGGLTTTALCLLASWVCALYVRQLTILGATYGSIAAVVILLIWISWNANAVFYGAALATEIEIIVGRREIKYLEDMRGRRPKATPAPRKSSLPRRD